MTEFFAACVPFPGPGLFFFVKKRKIPDTPCMVDRPRKIPLPPQEMGVDRDFLPEAAGQIDIDNILLGGL